MIRLRDVAHFLKQPHTTGRSRYPERCQVDGCFELTKRHIRRRREDEPLFICHTCVSDPAVQRSLR